MSQKTARLRTIYRIEGTILNGTEIEPILGLVAVKYPHRKSKDLYVPPMKIKNKAEAWHCCQDNCPQPDFEGGIDALVNHLMLHKGRLLRPWGKKQQLKAPLPAIKLPPNEWETNAKKNPCPTNEDRKFCVDLYIDDVKRTLRKQGLEILEEVSHAS